MISKWFVIFIVLVQIFNLAVAIDRHGETTTRKYNGWGTLIVTVIFFTLAWLGGMFKCFK